MGNEGAAEQTWATFQVVGKPIGEPRHRSFMRNGRMTAARNPMADPWKKAVRAAAIQARCKLFAGPVRVSLHFWVQRPKAHYVAGDRARPLKDSAPDWFTSKPDVDNMAKAVIDALGPWPKGAPPVAWKDDDIVVELHANKRYTPREAEPNPATGCDINIAEALSR